MWSLFGLVTFASLVTAHGCWPPKGTDYTRTQSKPARYYYRYAYKATGHIEQLLENPRLKSINLQILCDLYHISESEDPAEALPSIQCGIYVENVKAGFAIAHPGKDGILKLEALKSAAQDLKLNVGRLKHIGTALVAAVLDLTFRCDFQQMHLESLIAASEFYDRIGLRRRDYLKYAGEYSHATKLRRLAVLKGPAFHKMTTANKEPEYSRTEEVFL